MALNVSGWVVLAGLGVLAGCATPLQQCLNTADRDQRAILFELDERRANLRRGYRIERVMAPELVPALCPGPGGALQPCMRWAQDTREILHRINPELEAERIALLEQQLAREERRAAQAAAACRATYPAT